jgi:hypothetical protein
VAPALNSQGVTSRAAERDGYGFFEFRPLSNMKFSDVSQGISGLVVADLLSADHTN